MASSGAEKKARKGSIADMYKKFSFKATPERPELHHQQRRDVDAACAEAGNSDVDMVQIENRHSVSVGPGANTGTAATATTLSPGFSVTASMSVQVGIQGASSQLALAEGSTTRNDRERAKQESLALPDLQEENSPADSLDTLNCPTQELPGLGSDDDGNNGGPEVPPPTPPPAPFANVQRMSSQTSVTSFVKTRTGTTKGPTRFCCVTDCCKHGYDPSVAYHPKKPTIVNSLEDMMSWPHDFHAILSEALPWGALQYLHEEMRTATYSTAFSGIDTPGSAMLTIQEELANRFVWDGPHPVHTSAVEIYGPSQEELFKHPCAPRHCFRSVTDFWSEESKKQIDGMTAANGPIPEQLKKVALTPGAVKVKSRCVFHPQEDCELLRARIHVAGIVCISWSPFGKRKQEEGNDFVTFCAWSAMRRTIKELIVIWECSDRYDASLMNQMLGDLYLQFHMKVESLDYGMVGARRRTYGIMLLRSEVLARFTRLDNIIPMFYRARGQELGIHTIMVATKQELIRDLEWASNRPKSLAYGLTMQQVLACSNPHLAVLTQKEKDNLEMYKATYGQGLCFNLNQNADKRPIVSKYNSLFTLIHNCGILWYEADVGVWKKPRFISPVEITLYQGLASRVSLTLPRAKECWERPVPATCTFAVADHNRSRTAWAGQIGNGMCAPVVASFLYVAFLHCSYCRDSDRVIRENVMAEVLPKNKFLTKTAKLKAKVVAEKMKARAGKAKMSGGKSSAGTKVAKKMKKPASATGSKKGKNTNGSKSQGKRKAKSV